jgi:hypothetical protein
MACRGGLIIGSLGRMKSWMLFIISIFAFKVAAFDSSSSLDLGLHWIDYPITWSSIYPVNDQLYQGELKGSWEANISDTKKITTKIIYVADPTNNSKEEKNYVDLPEFNFKYKGETSSFKVGTEIFNWGITDGFNPVDFINTKQYFDPIHSRKMGAPSISASTGGETYDADLVYIPRARSSILPGTNSRWLPRDIYISGSAGGTGVELLLPKQFNYIYSELGPVDSALDNNIAFRLQFHLGSSELAFYAYDGVASMPLIKPRVSGNILAVSPITIIQVNSDVTLQLHDYRQSTGALSASKSIGEWLIKGVGTWTQSSPGATNLGWSYTSVFAAEKSWSLTENTTLMTIFQYSYCGREGSSGNDMMSIAAFFDRNTMLAGQLMWKDTDTFTFFYANDNRSGGWLSDLGYEHRVTDALRVNAKASVLDGSSGSPLGVYSDNKSITVGLNWTL